MKLVEQSFEIWNQGYTLDSILKHIEKCGRIAYKSEATKDSALSFVQRLISMKHGAVLEHGTVYLTYRLTYTSLDTEFINKYKNNKYSKIIEINDKVYITTNYRVIIENGWERDLIFYLSKPTKNHEQRITVQLTTDQGILREFTRHRAFSFVAESTRFCNYAKDKFNNEITCIIPSWVSDNDYITFKKALENAEQSYFSLLNNNWSPQQARNVLPLATKCDMVMTGFYNDWKHFFELRSAGTTGKPHPQAEELATAIKNEFKLLGYEQNK